MRSLLRASVVTGVLGFIFAACGSRTSLVDGELDNELDANTDGTTSDVIGRDNFTPTDAPSESSTDAPLVEGGPLDVQVDCNEPKYCDPRDTGYIYQCGVRVFQCSSLEECKDAQCVNPCVDTLGEDTSNGCEFYSSEMDITAEAKGACFAVFIVNQWKTGEPAKIQVDRAGTILPIEQFARIPSGTGTSITYSAFDAATGLPQNEIAILFLSRDPNAGGGDPTSPGALAACPPGVTPAIVGDASIAGTGTGNSFHIKTNVPVVGYQIFPYGGGRARVTAATLLLPTNVWGTNYVAANAYAASTATGVDGSLPTMTVLAQQDDTHVTINPVAGIVAGGGLAGSAANTPVSYILDKGEYLQFTQTAELTGSPVQSDNPIAIIGGQTLMDVPVTRGQRADGAEQMLPPVQALGNEYVAVRYRSRTPNSDPGNPESVPWRIVGAVDGTTLTFDPPIVGAPTTVNSKSFVELDAPGPFVVSSQDANHPFYFAQYMTGGDPFGKDSEGLGGEGDPEFVNVITPPQYLSRYTFFTDPTYPETNLVVTRVKDPTLGFPDVSLDCAGTLSGWTDIGIGGKYQFTRTDLSINNFQGVGGCNNGVHTMVATFAGSPASPVPFIGLTVWGWGSLRTLPIPDDPGTETNPAFTRWVSYGYPAGANITQLNSVVVSAH